jgi:hypothetical protein
MPRPLLDLYIIGPGSRWVVENAQIDTAADYSLLASRIASPLGLSLPYPHQVRISGAAGTQAATVSFPPDGLVSLFITDYREYAYLTQPLVGFHAPTPIASSQRSVLGLTSFLEHFRFVLDLPAAPPSFELHPQAGFPGSLGVLSRNQSLANIITRLAGTT